MPSISILKTFTECQFIPMTFQPKALIVWTNSGTTGSFLDNDTKSIGFASGVSGIDQRCITYESKDNVNTTNAMSKATAGIALQIDPVTGNTINKVELMNLYSDGFLVRYSKNTGNTFHYLALGGNDVTNAKVVDKAMSTTGTTDTIIGAGFKPDIIMGLCNNTTALDSSAAHANMSFGAAAGVNKSMLVASLARNAQNIATEVGAVKVQLTTFLWNFGNGPAQLRDAWWGFNSFNTDGAVLDILDPPSVSILGFFLFIKGPTFNVGEFIKNTATGNQSNVDVGFKPAALILETDNQVHSASIFSNSDWGLGVAASSTERGMIWAGTKDNVLATQANKLSLTNRIIDIFDRNADPPTITAEADFVSFDSNGFTINWITNNGLAEAINYIAIGPSLFSLVSKTYNLDTLISRFRINKTYTLDSVIARVRNIKTYLLDMVVGAGASKIKTYTIDTVLRLVGLTGLGIARVGEMVLGNTRLGEGFQSGFKTYLADVLITKKNIVKSYLIDSVISKINRTKTYTTDTFIVKRVTKTYQTDVNIKKNNILKTFLINAIIVVGKKTKVFTIDTLLKKLNISKTYTIDTLIKIILSKTYIIDTFIRKSIAKTYTIDSQLFKKGISKTYTQDVFITKKNIIKTYLIDSFIKKLNIIKTFTIDTLIQKLKFSKTFTIDSFLKKLNISNPGYAKLYYNMETLQANTGNMKDLTGTGNEGIIVGTVDIAGQYGRGRQFAGNSTDEIYSSNSFPASSVIPSFTMVAWANMPSAAGTNPRIIGARGNTGPQLIIYNGSTTHTIGDVNITNGFGNTAITFPLAGWHQLALAVSTTSAALYLDGSLINSKTAAISWASWTPAIGSDEVSTADTFPGSIDEVYIFNRQLTSTEVSALFINSPGNLLNHGYSIDAFIKKLNALKTFTIDTFLSKRFSKTFTIDSLLRKMFSKTYTIDILTQIKNRLKSFTIDAIIKKRFSKTYLINVSLKSITLSKLKTYAIGLIIRKKTHDKDKVIKSQESTEIIRME